MYALLLNDMRWSNVENITVVRTAENRDELVRWYEDQLAPEMYRDGTWQKAFKPGSELEWRNPHHDLSIDNHFMGGIWQVADDTPVGAGLFKR